MCMNYKVLFEALMILTGKKATKRQKSSSSQEYILLGENKISDDDK